MAFSAKGQTTALMPNARSYQFWLKLLTDVKANQSITSRKNLIREARNIPCHTKTKLLYKMIHDSNFRPSEYARLFSLLDSTPNNSFIYACIEETENFWWMKNFSCARNWLQMGVINALDSEFFTSALKRISGKHFGAIAGMLNRLLRSKLMTGSEKSSISKICRRIELGIDAAKIVEVSIISNKDEYRNYKEAIESTMRKFAIFCFNSSKPVLDKVVLTIMRTGKSMVGAKAVGDLLLYHVWGELRYVEPGFSYEWKYRFRRQRLDLIAKKCDKILELVEKVDFLEPKTKEYAENAYYRCLEQDKKKNAKALPTK